MGRYPRHTHREEDAVQLNRILPEVLCDHKISMNHLPIPEDFAEYVFRQIWLSHDVLYLGLLAGVSLFCIVVVICFVASHVECKSLFVN